jgi:hypothetical protein
LIPLFQRRRQRAGAAWAVPPLEAARSTGGCVPRRESDLDIGRHHYSGEDRRQSQNMPYSGIFNFFIVIPEIVARGRFQLAGQRSDSGRRVIFARVDE